MSTWLLEHSHYNCVDEINTSEPIINPEIIKITPTFSDILTTDTNRTEAGATTETNNQTRALPVNAQTNTKPESPEYLCLLL